MSAIWFALALLVGCSKGENSEQKINYYKYKVIFEVAERSEARARSIETSWEDGDQVLIVFNDGTQWLNPVNNTGVLQNALKLTCRNGVWSADVKTMPSTKLQSGSKFIAFYHDGDISLKTTSNEIYTFSQYNGGEFLQFNGTYEVVNDVVNLGTIKMQYNPNDFLYLVLGLKGDDWKLTISNEYPTNLQKEYIYHFQREGVKFERNNGQISLDEHYVDASGVEYDSYTSFCFRKKIDFNTDKLVFILTNGTDTYRYIKENTTLVGGKAYTLPAITDNRWTKL